MLAARRFARCKQSSRLLQYMIRNRTSPAALTESAVARAIFRRDEGFDPGLDTIVRTNIRRLRTKLRAYYEQEGWSDPVLVNLPAGSYIPVFEFRVVSQFTDLTGQVVAHYRLLRCERRNRWMSQYFGECLALQRPVMVTIPSCELMDDPERKSQLYRDWRCVAQSSIPSMAGVLALTETDFGPALVACAPQSPALAAIARHRKLGIEEMYTLARDLAFSVAALHRAGVAHGALQPGNVFLEATGKDVTTRIGAGGMTACSEDRWDGDADVVAVGSLIRFAVQGEIADLAPGLQELVSRCESTDASKRFHDAEELLQHVLACNRARSRPWYLVSAAFRKLTGMFGAKGNATIPAPLRPRP
jgi:hypothetical protein